MSGGRPVSVDELTRLAFVWAEQDRIRRRARRAR